MAEQRAQNTMPGKQPHPGQRLALAVERTVKNWPQWKRDTYNDYFAIASGAKKY